MVMVDRLVLPRLSVSVARVRLVPITRVPLYSVVSAVAVVVQLVRERMVLEVTRAI